MGVLITKGKIPSLHLSRAERSQMMVPTGFQQLSAPGSEEIDAFFTLLSPQTHQGSLNSPSEARDQECHPSSQGTLFLW